MFERKQSTIPVPGMLGVFSLVPFKKGQLVTTYPGKLIVNKQGKYEPLSTYEIAVNNTHFLNGDDVEFDPSGRIGVGPFINDPINARRTNVEFRPNQRNKTMVNIYAKKAIHPGQELLVSYGRSYWAFWSKNGIVPVKLP